MATADGGILRFVWGQDGNPVPSGQLRISPAGAVENSPLFSDQAMTVAATNPLIADGTGFIPSFYVTIGRYDFRYYDASEENGGNGALLYTVENVNILDYEEVTDLTLDLTAVQAKVQALETAAYQAGRATTLGGAALVVNFPEAYSSPPAVVITPLSNTSARRTGHVFAITTTQFSAVCLDENNTQTAMEFSWAAFGQRAP